MPMNDVPNPDASHSPAVSVTADTLVWNLR